MTSAFGPADLLRLWRAEQWKLWTRLPARIGAALSLFLGLVMPFVVYGGAWAMFRFAVEASAGAGGPAPEWKALPRDYGLMLALEARNFFVMAALVILLGAVSFAGEYQARTLREDLLRLVPRAAVLFAKWLSLSSWVWLTAALTWLPGLIVSVVVLRGEGDLAAITLGFAASALADCALAAMVLAFSVITRSVPASIAGLFLFYVLDYALHATLWVAKQVPVLPPLARQWIPAITPFLPSTSFSVWRGYADGFAWQGFAGLAAITAVSLLVSWGLFRRMDVP